MYVLDPDRGARRRALVRDQFVHMINKISDAFGATARDIRNRVRGLVAEAGSIFRSDPVSDDVLIQRVRSMLGRIVSHPYAIEVKAQNGNPLMMQPPIKNCERS
jgi:hypothetical protein